MLTEVHSIYQPGSRQDLFPKKTNIFWPLPAALQVVCRAGDLCHLPSSTRAPSLKGCLRRAAKTQPALNFRHSQNSLLTTAKKKCYSRHRFGHWAAASCFMGKFALVILKQRRIANSIPIEVILPALHQRNVSIICPSPLAAL